MTPHIFVSINIIGVRLVTSTQAGVRTDTVGLHDGTFHIKKMTDNEFHKETLNSPHYQDLFSLPKTPAERCRCSSSTRCIYYVFVRKTQNEALISSILRMSSVTKDKPNVAAHSQSLTE